MAEVLLTHSYHLAYDRKQVVKQQPYPPLGTLYAAALLRENGMSVGVFDTMLNDPKAGFAEALRAHRPKIVAIYEDDFNFLTKMCLTRMREVAWEMIEEARSAGARVVVHGSDATDHASEYLAQGAEFVLVGAAEATLLNVVRAVSCNGDAGEIPGVASASRRSLGRDARGLRVARKPVSNASAELAALPMPARDLIDVNQYRRAWHRAHGRGKFSLNMVASRGCPFRCNWCAKPIFGDAFYVRPAGDVAREMQMLKQEYGAEHIWFADDIFGLNRHWVQELAKEVERLECAVPFKVQARADLLTRETAGALRRAGCAEVWMGVESGSQKILDAMDKGLRIAEVASARESLRQEGIRACYFLQLGYPGETWADIRKTIEFVRATRPDDIGVSFSYPLPNTKFYSLVQQQLGAKRNWADSEDLCVMFRGTYTDAFYRLVRDALHAEVDGWHGAGAEVGASAAAGVGAAAARRRRVSELWRRIERAEASSRNAAPTELPRACAAEGADGRGVDGNFAACEEERGGEFVSIQGLVASTGEA